MVLRHATPLSKVNRGCFCTRQDPPPTVIGSGAIKTTGTPFHFTDRVPSFLDGYGDYQQFEENILHCNVMTLIDADSRAPNMIGQLTGQTQITSNTLSTEVQISTTEVDKLSKKLDKNICSR